MRSTSFIRALAAAAVMTAGLSSLAVASADPVSERQDTMKSIGQAMKDGVGLTAPATFDAAKAKAAMGTVAADAKKLSTLFPAGSDTDPKTAADPKIWQNSDDFNKRLVELATLATTAGNATSLDDYRPAFKAVGATCKSCHDVYRKKKPG
ncbi:MAG: cytochrome C [Alphaproteobacteria bacterium]|nr:cytochrome C [Alphaproteobacteria bacterium]